MPRFGLKAAMILNALLAFGCESKFPERPNPSQTKKPSISKSTNPSADAEATLFNEANALVKTFCHQCHGQNQSNSGGLTNITDLAQKITEGLIVAGDPESSKIFERMISKSSPMPPAGQAKPSGNEIEKFKLWISQGAKTQFGKPVVREIVSEEKLLNDAGLDLLKEFPNPEDRKQIRYLSLASAHNAGASEETLQTLKQASVKILNSLSHSQEVYKIKISAKNPLLIRFSLSDIGWSEQDWVKIVKSYPYQIVPFERKILSVLQEQTKTTLPVVRADWLVATASQPPLYYSLLNLPEKFVDLTNTLNIDLIKSQQSQDIIRAGFNNSEVAENSRVIERVESSRGDVMWHSYEFGSSLNDKNPFQNPFGPGNVFAAFTKSRKFNSDGKEVIFTLPNNFLGFYVADQLGNRLNEAPTRARNASVISGVAIVGVACMTCHSQGLLEKRDQIRDASLKRTDLSESEVKLLKAIYPESDALNAKIKADTMSFQTALKDAGVDFSQPDPVSRIFKTFNDSVSLSIAAGELGVPEVNVKSAIESSQTLNNSLSALTTNGTISRSIFSTSFQTLMTALFANQ